MTEKIVEFDMSNEDTCMKHWAFTLQENSDGVTIQSIKIKPSPEGCVGHPKTIMALVRNTPIEAIDTDHLHAAKCIRTKSCGMNLASCVEAIMSESN